MIKSITSLILVFKNSILKISRNVIWLLGLNVFIAICQFSAYAIISRSLGKEYLGVWALVIATTTIGQISSFGFSSGLVRYIPELVVNNRKSELSKMVSTVNFSNLIISLPVLFILFFPAKMYAQHLLNTSDYHVFEQSIVWVMIGMFINNLFSVYSAIFDGFQKFYTRCIIQISGWIIFLIGIIMLIPSFGLQGVAIAFLLQSIWQLFSSVIILIQQRIIKNPFSIYFDKKSFKLISSFGIKSQSISILVIFFDPVIKYFITKNLGLTATANFELSNKIVLQTRNLLASANQVLIPKFVLHRKTNTHEPYFEKVMKRNLVISITLGVFICLISPFINLFLLNRFDKDLMVCMILINFGWVCNMITSVHYNASIGLDKLNKLIIVHLIYAVTAIVGYLLLQQFSHLKTLFYFAPALSLFLGSLYNSFSLSKVLPSSTSWLKSDLFLFFILMSIAIILIPFSSITKAILIVSLFSIIYCIIIWVKHGKDYFKRISIR